jgi:hypothetical protein
MVDITDIKKTFGIFTRFNKFFLASIEYNNKQYCKTFNT